jgi:hypothetical protein
MLNDEKPQTKPNGGYVCATGCKSRSRKAETSGTCKLGETVSGTFFSIRQWRNTQSANAKQLRRLREPENRKGNGARNHFIIEEKAIGCGYGENGARNGS